MATSAIGPGFLTQTTVFTQQLGASFGFAILLSVLLDVGAQLNVWRIVTASGQRAPDLADSVVPGLGLALTVLIALGGLAFNIGNLAGTGLGLEALTGLPAAAGATLSALVAMALFWRKEAGQALDGFARILGVGMILLTAWVAVASQPPLVAALRGTILPERIDWSAVVTLVGGTVGGYITFAGAHRLLEAGITDPATVRRSALSGIGIAAAMRLLLFLAAWGVVADGQAIDAVNPPAAMFRLAAGELGYRFFGLVMWAAAITSVTGATFTTLSFVEASVPRLAPHRARLAAVFILISLGVFLTVGRPVKTLLMVGLLNGFILPVALAVMLLAARRRGLAQPIWLTISGWAVVVAMGWMAARAVF